MTREELLRRARQHRRQRLQVQVWPLGWGRSSCQEAAGGPSTAGPVPKQAKVTQSDAKRSILRRGGITLTDERTMVATASPVGYRRFDRASIAATRTTSRSSHARSRALRLARLTPDTIQRLMASTSEQASPRKQCSTSTRRCAVRSTRRRGGMYFHATPRALCRPACRTRGAVPSHCRWACAIGGRQQGPSPCDLCGRHVGAPAGGAPWLCWEDIDFDMKLLRVQARFSAMTAPTIRSSQERPIRVELFRCRAPSSRRYGHTSATAPGAIAGE